MRVGELLVPIVTGMGRELVKGSYIQADETPVDVQMHDRRGRAEPKEILGRFEGILQTDGYIAYNQVGGPKMVHVGCWAHARRHFIDAVKLNPSDAIATAIVRRMDELFGIDAEARAPCLPARWARR
jgi:hypothetical protein